MLDRALQRQAIAKCIGENLGRLRKAAGLSQFDLALMAEVDRTEISDLERGNRCPRADTVFKLCACLEADCGELFEGLTWTPAQRHYGSLKVKPVRE